MENTDFAPDDIVGFGHYNKAISISKKVAQKWLKTNPSGFITIKPSQIRNHPIEKEAIAMITGVKRSGIKYSEAWDKLYNPDASAKYDCCRGGNMFITTAEQFQKYCDWFFPILAFMRSEIGDKLDSSPYWKRYCAYAGERLLSVYIEANSLPVKSCNVKYKKWWLPICRKIIQAFHLSKNSLFYKKLKRRFGYSSQYKI